MTPTRPIGERALCKTLIAARLVNMATFGFGSRLWRPLLLTHVTCFTRRRATARPSLNSP